MGVGNRGRGPCSWILKFDIFLITFLAKMVVFLASRRKNEIPSVLASPGKKSYG